MTTNTKSIIARVFQTYVTQPRWVGWHTVNDNKVPLIGNSKRNASTSDPKTWRTFEQCPGDRRGIVFNGDGLGGVDLDGCRDPTTGNLADWAAELIKDFDSYAEVSPSGTGVKIFARGAPASLAKHVWPMNGEPIKDKQPQIEAYVSKRFFTVTGNQLPQTPDQIRAAPAVWQRLLRRKSNNTDKQSDMAKKGRNGALLSLGCRLQAAGKSDDEIEVALRAANVAGNVELHKNFANGPLPEQQLKTILRSVLNYPKGNSADQLLARLNAEYCVIQDGGKTRVLRFDLHEHVKDGRVVHRRLVPSYFGFGDFHNFYKNEKVWENEKPVPLGQWWTGHLQRRTYKGLTFRPDLQDESMDA
jgi:hypothetical protein